MVKIDQSIGIEYTVSGVDNIIKQHQTLAQSFEQTLDRIKKSVSSANSLAANSFQQFSPKNAKDNFSGLADVQTRALDTNRTVNALLDESKAKRVDRLTERLHSTAGLAHKAANEIERLVTAVTAYNAAVGASKGMKFNFTTSDGTTTATGTQPRDTTKSGKKEKTIADEFLDKSAFFMLRYRAYSSIFDAFLYSLSDILLGRSRQKLAEGLGELSSVAFSSSQKKQTEFAAQQFSMKFWNVTTEEYVKAMTMTASAFDISKLGFSNLQRMNEAAIKFGKLSKLAGEQSAELMSGIVLQVMARLPEDVRAALNEGKMADVKGYGVTDIGGISEKIAAQAAKAIQISTVWGPGIAGAFKYMLPELMEKGWDVSAALSLLGAVKNQGFPAEQIGRATKEIFLSAPLDFAKAVLHANDMWEVGGQNMALTKGQAKEINENRVKKLGDWITKNFFSTPEAFEKAMPILGEYVRKAEKKGKFPIEDLGFSKYFMSVIRQITEKGTMDKFGEYREQIGNASYDAIGNMVEEQLADAGTAWMRISNAFNRLYQTLADTPLAHQIAGGGSFVLDYMTTLFQVPKQLRLLQEENSWSKEKTLDYFDKQHRKGFEKRFGKPATDAMLDDYVNKDDKVKVFLNRLFGVIGGKLAGTTYSIVAGWLGQKKAAIGDKGSNLLGEAGTGWENAKQRGWAEIENIKAKLGGYADWVSENIIATNLWLQSIPEKLGMFFDSMIESISKGWEWLKTLPDKLIEAIGSVFTGMIDALTNIKPFESIARWFNGDKGNQSPATELAKQAAGDNWFLDKYNAVKDFIFGMGNEEWPPNWKSNKQSAPEIDTAMGREMLNKPEQLPPLLPQLWPPSFPALGAMQQMSQADDTPIQIENKLIIDGRELAYVIAEIIQRNRAANYQGFGGDPFGFNVGIG